MDPASGVHCLSPVPSHCCTSLDLRSSSPACVSVQFSFWCPLWPDDLVWILYTTAYRPLMQSSLSVRNWFRDPQQIGMFTEAEVTGSRPVASVDSARRGWHVQSACWFRSEAGCVFPSAPLYSVIALSSTEICICATVYDFVCLKLGIFSLNLTDSSVVSA